MDFVWSENASASQRTRTIFRVNAKKEKTVSRKNLVAGMELAAAASLDCEAAGTVAGVDVEHRGAGAAVGSHAIGLCEDGTVVGTGGGCGCDWMGVSPVVLQTTITPPKKNQGPQYCW